MQKHSLTLILILGAFLMVMPALAADSPSAEALSTDALAATATVEAACSDTTTLLEPTALESALQAAGGGQGIGCPNWRCTNALQCGYECGEAKPTCSNLSGGTCAGWCICY